MSELAKCQALILSQQKLISELRKQNDLLVKRTTYVCDNQCMKRSAELFCSRCEVILCDYCREECWNCDAYYCSNCSSDCIFERKCATCEVDVGKCERCDDRSTLVQPCCAYGCKGQMFVI